MKTQNSLREIRIRLRNAMSRTVVGNVTRESFDEKSMMDTRGSRKNIRNVIYEAAKIVPREIYD